MRHAPSVGIVSVGVGNIAAIEGSLRRLCIKSSRVSSPDDLSALSHLFIPGVGAMGEFMARLRATCLDQAIKVFAGHGKILGICLGFQSLYSYSHEGQCECLNLLEGEVKSLSDYTNLTTNVGYLQIIDTNPATTSFQQIVPAKPLLSENISTRSHMNNNEYYFTHSYFVPVVDSTTHVVQPDSKTLITAASSNGDNIYGTQFHPELSHSIGRTLISQFLAK